MLFRSCTVHRYCVLVSLTQALLAYYLFVGLGVAVVAVVIVVIVVVEGVSRNPLVPGIGM